MILNYYKTHFRTRLWSNKNKFGIFFLVLELVQLKQNAFTY